jgi:hypothetical protein
MKKEGYTRKAHKKSGRARVALVPQTPPEKNGFKPLRRTPQWIDMAIHQQSTICLTVFGLELGADDRILPRPVVVFCLRSVVPPGPGETSRI